MLAKPFLKWPGGKRSSAQKIITCLPAEITDYYEPMVGGGAVFFSLQSAGRIKGSTYLGDLNDELMLTYSALATAPEMVIGELRKINKAYYKCKSTEERAEMFYTYRRMDVDQMLQQELAARMIFLNKTCYNGLYRVNQKGQFNAPFGDYPKPRILDEQNLNAVYHALSNTKNYYSSHYDYWMFPSMKEFTPGSVVYFDPPYLKKSKNSFVSYTHKGFGYDDHVQLANFATMIMNEHPTVTVAVSNIDLPEVRKLYKPFIKVPISAPRNINSDGKGRGKVKELLLLSRI